MRGRWLAILAVTALGVALAMQTVRLIERRRASIMLIQIELISQAIESGRIPPAQLALNLETLRRVAELDPGETRVALDRGNQYLLFPRPRTMEAISAYRDAERLEPRPETYLHLGQAYELAGQAQEARRYYRLALRLDPTLAPNVPAAMQ